MCHRLPALERYFIKSDILWFDERTLVLNKKKVNFVPALNN